MRILIVGAHVRIMLDETLRNLNHKACRVECSSSNGTIIVDGNVIVCAVIRQQRDLERFAGQRFDLIVEHSTLSIGIDLGVLRETVLR